MLETRRPVGVILGGGIEPDAPSSPLLGIVEALALAGDRPVLVCPADLPFVTPDPLDADARQLFDVRLAVGSQGRIPGISRT
jgi:molybdopterin-guanine dinucleotide biosynthesis protein A